MKTITTLLATAAVAAAGSFAYAESHADPVKMRQETMKTIGGGMKVLSDMAKGKTDFDAAAATAALATMAEAAGTIPTVFETEAQDVESEAKDDIWSNWGDFVSKAEALKAATTEASVSEAGDMQGVMGSVGAACGACHKAYKI